MALFGKGNPVATRALVIRRALIGGSVGLAVCVAILCWHDAPAVWWAVTLPATVYSAGVQALIAWQVPSC